MNIKIKNYAIVNYWNKHKFKFIVAVSLIVIAIAWYYDDDEPGTWSTTYHYVPSEIKGIKREPRGPRESKGEKECRRVLQELFNAPFPSCRPQYMQNSVTKHKLELDCYNEEMALAVEYNGKQHYEFVKAFHKNHEAFRNQQYRDKMKEQLCVDNGILLITVPYWIEEGSIHNYLREKLTSYGYRI